MDMDIIKLSDFALSNFHNIIGYNSSNDIYCYVPIDEKSNYLVNNKIINMYCIYCGYNECYECWECGNYFCEICVTWKIEKCGLLNCGNHTIKSYCGLEENVPHMHYSDNNVPCDCYHTTMNDLKYYSKTLMNFNTNAQKDNNCPIPSIIKLLIKKCDNVLSLFDGGCGCSPSCGCLFKNVQFVGENKTIYEGAVNYGYDYALKKWLPKYK